ncbi:hypothetical protein Tco_1271792 [Tanacetum coccineum]
MCSVVLRAVNVTRLRLSDAFCQKYHIPDTVHPELHGPNQNIRNSPAGKIGIYTRFFDFANFQIPLFRFLADVLEYFRINLSQLSAIAAAKISHFEILCHVHGYVSTVGFFFWVDASVFPSSIPWYTKKTLARDPSPTVAEFSAEACDFLATHPAPFRKFPERFLCLVGLSRYYDLDANVYPTFLTDTGEEMDLFAFIRHADPTKVRIGKRQIKEGHVPLLDSTKGRVIPLAGEDSQAGSVVRVDHGGQNDNIKNLNEGSGDADQENHSEDSDRAGQDEAVTIFMDEEFRAAAANKTKSKKKKRIAAGASDSDHPPKKLGEDHDTSGDAGASTGGKSLAALQGLLERSILAVEGGVTAATTVPFVTSSVTPTPEREGDGNTDSVSMTNLRTQRPSERFVISSDSSHHSSTNAAEAEVTSIIRSPILPPPLMTAAVTTTVIAGTSSALVIGAGAEPVS